MKYANKIKGLAETDCYSQCGLDDLRVFAHAQVVVTTPNGDVPAIFHPN